MYLQWTNKLDINTFGCKVTSVVVDNSKHILLMSMFLLRMSVGIHDGQGRQWLSSLSESVARLVSRWMRMSMSFSVRLSICQSLSAMTKSRLSEKQRFFWHPHLPAHLLLLPWYDADENLGSLSRRIQSLSSASVIHFASQHHSESRPFNNETWLKSIQFI